MNRQKEYTEEGRYTPISKVSEGGSSDGVVFDEIQYVSDSGLKVVEPTWDESGGLYYTIVTDLVSYIYGYSDGSLIVSVVNPDDVFFHAFKGEHGVHGFRVQISTK